jgi:hypothetical protein
VLVDLRGLTHAPHAVAAHHVRFALLYDGHSHAWRAERLQRALRISIEIRRRRSERSARDE